MRYMGDYLTNKNQTEVDCVYAILVVSCVRKTSLSNVLTASYITNDRAAISFPNFVTRFTVK